MKCECVKIKQLIDSEANDRQFSVDVSPRVRSSESESARHFSTGEDHTDGKLVPYYSMHS